MSGKTMEQKSSFNDYNLWQGQTGKQANANSVD
jgi:hypothetical protein